MCKRMLCILTILLIPALTFAVTTAGLTEKQYVNQANKMFEIGQYEDAINLYNTALQIDQNNASAYMGLGNCYRLLRNEKEAQKMYERAKAIDPTLKEPDLDHYFELEKGRGMNVDRIRARYWALFGKGATPTAEAETAALPQEKPQVKSPEASKEDLKKSEEEKEWWSRGGLAKMTSLGEIKFVYPDLSTAMDGAAHGIDAGLLFRRDKHFFELQPFAGRYNDTEKNPGYEKSQQAFAATIDNSYGEIGWPNKYFMNSIKPLYLNSFNMSKATDADSRITNSGNLYGGEYMAGFKPIPLFGIAGHIGYEYVPYINDVNTAGIDTHNSNVLTQLFWDVSSGIFLPYLATQSDELDITASFGSYSPVQDLSDTGEFLGLPQAFVNSYSAKTTYSSPVLTINSSLQDILNVLGITPDPGTITHDVSTLTDATGYDIKGNIHYMIGNAQHEFFLYAEAPVDIEYKQNTTDEINANIAGISKNLQTVATDKITTGTERKFHLETGIRDNFKYVMPGIKYMYDYDEAYSNLTSTSTNFNFVGREITKTHTIVTGLNIMPVDQITLPVEFQYSYRTSDLFSSGMGMGGRLDTTGLTVRGGLELKPIPVAAIRGGLSYEFVKNDGSAIGGIPSGQQGNPYYNAVGYHLGGGFDMPLFELNVGGVYKKLYSSPSLKGITTFNNDFLYGYVDLNIYI